MKFDLIKVILSFATIKKNLCSLILKRFSCMVALKGDFYGITLPWVQRCKQPNCNLQTHEGPL
jgi:hypothetical protein